MVTRQLQLAAITIDDIGEVYGLLPICELLGDLRYSVTSKTMIASLVEAHMKGLIDDSTELVILESVTGNIYSLDMLRGWSKSELYGVLQQTGYGLTETGITLNGIDSTCNMESFIYNILLNNLSELIQNNISIKDINVLDLSGEDTAYAIVAVSHNNHEYLTRTPVYQLPNGLAVSQKQYESCVDYLIKMFYNANNTKPLGFILVKYQAKLEDILTYLLDITTMQTAAIPQDSDLSDVDGLLKIFVDQVNKQGPAVEAVVLTSFADCSTPRELQTKLRDIRYSRLVGLLDSAVHSMSLHDVLGKYMI